MRRTRLIDNAVYLKLLSKTINGVQQAPGRLVQSVAHTPKARRATKPTYGSKQRRLAGKALRSGIKAGRGRVTGGKGE